MVEIPPEIADAEGILPGDEVKIDIQRILE